MKPLIWVLIIVAAIYSFKFLLSYWSNFKDKDRPAEQRARATPAAGGPIRGEDLQGLPANFESSLQAAQAQGADGLKNWLKLYSAYVADPRLAWIELDYVVLISRQDPKEARRVFQLVKQRTPATSPVYERVKKLEKTYG